MSAFRITTTMAKTGAVIVTEYADWSAMYDAKCVLEKAGECRHWTTERFEVGTGWYIEDRRTYSDADLKAIHALNQRIKDEQKAVKKIVERAIRTGYMVSLYDGEEYTVKRSVDKKAIMAAIYTTDMDRLYFRVKATGEQVGSVLLVYGNCASEVMADWSDNDAVNDILADAVAFCEKLSAKGL